MASEVSTFICREGGEEVCLYSLHFLMRYECERGNGYGGCGLVKARWQMITTSVLP